MVLWTLRDRVLTWLSRSTGMAMARALAWRNRWFSASVKSAFSGMHLSLFTPKGWTVHSPTSASVLIQLSMLAFWGALSQVQLQILKEDWSSLMKMDWFVCRAERIQQCFYGNMQKTVVIETLLHVIFLRPCTDPRSLQIPRRITRLSVHSCGDSMYAHMTCRPDAQRKTYLQVGVVNRERRAEEALDNGHHCLCHVFLPGRIGMITICGAVAHLR